MHYEDIVGEDRLDRQKSKPLSHLRHMKLVALVAKVLNFAIRLALCLFSSVGPNKVAIRSFGLVTVWWNLVP